MTARCLKHRVWSDSLMWFDAVLAARSFDEWFTRHVVQTTDAKIGLTTERH